ncbi:interleukin-23 receptor isoform X1 [Heliangelus exortis]|uniref:interleukin-23 receptor isoform X1 n=1 Tax=Heliangelus exortis TaxID=472823 RepID=UPI003A94CAE8
MLGSSTALVLHVLLCWVSGGVGVNIKCSGHVWIEPSGVVQMGSNISINCFSTLGCSQFFIFLNLSQAEGPLHPINSSTVQLQLRDFQMPFGTFTCFTLCPNRDKRQLVCGTQVWAGYPPDPPRDLQCSIKEGSGTMVCQWDTGQPTHLPTHYTLHLHSLGPAVLEDAEEEEEVKEEVRVFPAGSPVLLSSLPAGSHYSAWVEAKNPLGTSRSALQHLDLQELVVPALPQLTGAQTTETWPPITTIFWRRQTQLENVTCEERHRATDTPGWQVEVWDGAEPQGAHQHQDLQGATQYLFQVRCRLSPAHSPWSSWGPPFLYTTPEAAPPVAPQVWWRPGPTFPNGSHQVTVLVKPLHPQDARGRVLGYRVTTGSSGEKLLLCHTSGTLCHVLVPPGTRVLHVTAHSSGGASGPAATIPLGWGAGGHPEFPAPLAVQVQAKNGSRVWVSWEPPPPQGRGSPLWFIVEWVPSTPFSQEEKYFWKKVPSQETHTDLQAEAGAGGPMEVSVYAVYPDGVSKPSSRQVPPEILFLGSTHTELSHDADTAVFLGLGTSVLIFSTVFVILMVKKSARKRVKARVVSLLPTWLLEDFPHMEKSKVLRSLQTNSDFPSSSFHEAFLDTSDPPVMEIQEVAGEQQEVASSREPSREIPEAGEQLSTPTPQQISAYRPQVAGGNPLGYIAAPISPAQPPAPEPEPEPSSFFRDYSRPFAQLWDGEGGGSSIPLLEKLNLILTPSPPTLGSAWGARGSPLGGPRLGEVQEQTLVPEELLSCLRPIRGVAVDGQPCFPQSLGRMF